MSEEWTDEKRLALKPKNDPPHPCKRCRLVIFWCFYPPENKETYVNDAIDNNMAYFGQPHLCFPCEWGCGRILWFRPATPLRPRRKVDADGEHIKEHWCVNRRIFENKITPILELKLAKDGTTREQKLVEIVPEIERIAQEEADRKIQVGTSPTQEQVDKEVESIATTGKLPPTIETNPIFSVLKEEKGKAPKAQFKTADKLLDHIENSGDFPDKELADNIEKEMVEHRQLSGEVIDSLTKKVVDTIARVEKLEELINKIDTRATVGSVSGFNKLEDHIARIYKWIGEVQAAVNRFTIGGPP